jgi:hypothetical protein
MMIKMLQNVDQSIDAPMTTSLYSKGVIWCVVKSILPEYHGRIEGETPCLTIPRQAVIGLPILERGQCPISTPSIWELKCYRMTSTHKRTSHDLDPRHGIRFSYHSEVGW